MANIEQVCSIFCHVAKFHTHSIQYRKSCAKGNTIQTIYTTPHKILLQKLHYSIEYRI